MGVNVGMTEKFNHQEPSGPKKFTAKARRLGWISGAVTELLDPQPLLDMIQAVF